MQQSHVAGRMRAGDNGRSWLSSPQSLLLQDDEGGTGKAQSGTGHGRRLSTHRLSTLLFFGFLSGTLTLRRSATASSKLHLDSEFAFFPLSALATKSSSCFQVTFSRSALYFAANPISGSRIQPITKDLPMHKLLMLAVVLTALSVGMQAQAYPQTSAGQTSDQSMSSKTVEGCLQGSNGSYTLMAKDGTMYQLSGDTSKLADHVGHEVQITGTTWRSATDASAGAAAAGSQPTLEVKSVKHVSKGCKSSSDCIEAPSLSNGGHRLPDPLLAD
jgi:hypothetical protein